MALYVPDATVRAMSENGSLGPVILDGVPELDFLPPPWWENSTPSGWDSHSLRSAQGPEHSKGRWEYRALT